MRRLLLSGLFVVQFPPHMGNVQRGVLLLQEENTEMYLVVWIGMLEIGSIASEIKGVKLNRPRTHDLCVSFIEELGASVDRVTINDLRDDTYYAEIILRVGQKTKELDARPNDAVAIALRSNVDIFVKESVFEKTVVTKEEALKKLRREEEGESNQTPPLTDEELKGLKPFRGLIEGLADIDKLGSGGPGDPQTA